jgi:hypothetical protein
MSEALAAGKKYSQCHKGGKLSPACKVSSRPSSADINRTGAAVMVSWQVSCLPTQLPRFTLSNSVNIISPKVEAN